MAKKIAEIQPDLDKIKESNDLVNGKINKLNSELANIQEPIKRLSEEKNTVLKKLNQKVLDKCSKFLLEKTHPDIQFIMEHLVGIMRGENESYSFWVELYMKSIDNLTLYLNRIDYSLLNTEELKKTLEELLNERA